MRNHIAGVFTLLSVAMLATAAPPSSTEEIEVPALLAQIEAQNSARLEQARALAASGEPRKLYAASLLLPLQMNQEKKQIIPQPEANAWLAQAIEKGSDDPLIAAAAVTGCIQHGECAIGRAELTLQSAGADDAAQQLLLMRLAEHRGDTVGIAKAWQRTIDARYYGDSLAQLLGLLEEATRDMPWPVSDPRLAAEQDGRSGGGPADQDRTIALFGIAAANWQPGLQQISTACPKNGSDATRTAECRRLFALAADSTSPLLAQLGTREMLAADVSAPAQAQSKLRLRDLEWVIQQAGKLLSTVGGETAKATPLQYARWVAANGELPAMRQLLAVNQIALQPPADWQPTQMQQ